MYFFCILNIETIPATYWTPLDSDISPWVDLLSEHQIIPTQKLEIQDIKYESHCEFTKHSFEAWKCSITTEAIQYFVRLSGYWDHTGEVPILFSYITKDNIPKTVEVDRILGRLNGQYENNAPFPDNYAPLPETTEEYMWIDRKPSITILLRKDTPNQVVYI